MHVLLKLNNSFVPQTPDKVKTDNKNRLSRKHFSQRQILKNNF